MVTESLWTATEVLNGSESADDLALAVVGEIPHLVWSQAGGLFHAYRSPEGWSEAAPITDGQQPVAVAGDDGRLHCVFAHEFMGNADIYYMAWDGSNVSPPFNVSRTTGASGSPALATGPNAGLHAAWAEKVPGRSLIYYGRQDGTAWSSSPIPGARGDRPSIAVDRNGAVLVAWQDRPIEDGRSAIYCSILAESGFWSIPEAVSSSGRDATLPSLASGPAGACHITWLEEQDGTRCICHSYRRASGWLRPAIPLAGQPLGAAPRTACNPQSYLQAVWLEEAGLVHRVRPPDPAAPWWAAENLTGPRPAARNPVIAVSGRGRAHVAWLDSSDPDGQSLHYAQRRPLFKHSVLMPVVSRSAKGAGRSKGRQP